jgi:hypothetical protein
LHGDKGAEGIFNDTPKQPARTQALPQEGEAERRNDRQAIGFFALKSSLYSRKTIHVNGFQAGYRQ